MSPSFMTAVAGFTTRYWKLALLGVLLATLFMLKFSLALEQRHAARLQQRLSETAAAHGRFRADVAARTALAKAQD